MSWKINLGSQIKEARSRSGLTQVQLAEKLSVTRAQLGNYEKGVSAIPVNILAEIAEALQVEAFTVAGYRVVPEKSRPTPAGTPDPQMSLKFGDEQRFANDRPLPSWEHSSRFNGRPEATLSLLPCGKM